MKFVYYENNNKECIGIIKDEKIIPLNNILNQISQEPIYSMMDVISNIDEGIMMEIESYINDRDITCSISSKSSAGNTYIPIESVRILAPIPYPKRNIICLGKNYVEHAKEIKTTKISDTFIPEEPIYFTKTASPAIGIEEYITFSSEVTKQVDYEAELAIVIGKEGKDIKPEEAEEYIFGYTIINDISARDLQVKHKQWFKAKSLDTFCPMGPCIVHKSSIPFPVELDIQCKINGELRQNSNTRKLIFDIPYIISDLSKDFTLKPGDIISTGTPSGVGMGFEPPKFLKDGDIVECYVERIGKLVNIVSVNQ